MFASKSRKQFQPFQQLQPLDQFKPLKQFKRCMQVIEEPWLALKKYG
jgi:hypothetical protein